MILFWLAVCMSEASVPHTMHHHANIDPQLPSVKKTFSRKKNNWIQFVRSAWFLCIQLIHSTMVKTTLSQLQ
jgi:hypothetical protein